MNDTFLGCCCCCFVCTLPSSTVEPAQVRTVERAQSNFPTFPNKILLCRTVSGLFFVPDFWHLSGISTCLIATLAGLTVPL